MKKESMNLAMKTLRGFLALFLICSFASCNSDKDFVLYPAATRAASLNAVDSLNLSPLNDVMMQTLYWDASVDEVTKYGLSGYYRQEACAFYGVYHPEILTTDIGKATSNFVHQGCMVYLTLYGIGSRRVSHSGVTPDVWFYNGGTQIQFQLPLGSGGIPFYVEIGDDGSGAKQRILFFSVSNNGNISQ